MALTHKQLSQEIRNILYPAYEELLTAAELADLLKLSKAYIYSHVDKFPHIKIGGSIRFPKTKVLEALIV